MTGVHEQQAPNERTHSIWFCT